MNEPVQVIKQKRPLPEGPGALAQPAPGQVVDHPATAEARLAQLARPKWRHRAAAVSFLLAVLLPAILTTSYLYLYAADQYASRVAFSVRSGETMAPVEVLGMLTQSLGGSGGLDAEIIYEFVRSQQMVETALAALPLEAIYNAPQEDWVFRLGEDRPIEEVIDYWNWMTDISFEATTGVVNFEARAFDPDSARAIAALVLAESTRLVNDLSIKAREDAVSVAREVLGQSEDRLRDVRRKLRAFRDIEQEIDPSLNARAALGLVSELEGELARTEIELDTQRALVGARDPRIPYLVQKIESLRSRIVEERTRLGTGTTTTTPDGRAFSDLVADYEELIVDQEFAQRAYVTALAASEQAQIEARRQIRYLSPHVDPTLSVSAQYPQRALISVGIFTILLVGWAVLLLIFYNIRDRR